MIAFHVPIAHAHTIRCMWALIRILLNFVPMGKHRTVQSKRRQRRRQALKRKLKKRSNSQTKKTESSATMPLTNMKDCMSSSSFGDPGTPPLTPSSYVSGFNDSSVSFFDNANYQESIDKQDEKMLHEIEECSLTEQYEKMKHLFLERTKVLHSYTEQVDELQLQKEQMAQECVRRVKEVRSFWRDKICSNRSRSAKLVNAALQK